MILYETKFLSLKSYKRENKPDWVYAVRPNAKDVVIVLPLIKNGTEEEILFLLTKRPPLIAENVAEFCVELPAGLVGDEDKNETPIDAIKKELLEETGLVADKVEIILDKMSSSSGLTSETSTVAICYINDKNIKTPPINDGGVIAERIYVKKSKINDFLSGCSKKGFAISSQSLAALYLYLTGIKL